MLKLQVFHDEEWGTLNAMAIGNSTNPEVISHATEALTKMQSAWSANYDRFKDSDVKFRIVRE